MALEMFEVMDRGTKIEKTLRHQELADLMRRAEAGRLLWGEDLVDVMRHAHLFEMRWDLFPYEGESPPVVARLYFAEPPSDPTLLLALHLHLKDLDAGVDIRAEQNAAMDLAELRRLDWLDQTRAS